MNKGVWQRVQEIGLPRLLRLLVLISIPPSWLEILLLHYRGSFQNPYMWVPVVALPLVLLGGAGSLLAGGDREERARFRPFGWLMTLVGSAGTFFHLVGVRRQRPAPDADGPGRGSQQGGYNPEEGGLAGPIGPDQGDKFPGPNLQIDPAQDRQHAIIFDKSLDSDHTFVAALFVSSWVRLPGFGRMCLGAKTILNYLSNVARSNFLSCRRPETG